MSERKAREFWIIDKAYHRYMEVSCYEAWNEKPIAEDDETLILVREVLPDDELEKLRAEIERWKEQMKVYDRMRAKGVYYTTEEAIARSNELTRVKSAAQMLVEELESYARLPRGTYYGPDDSYEDLSNGAEEALAEWRKEMGDEQKESGNV